LQRVTALPTRDVIHKKARRQMLQSGWSAAKELIRQLSLKVSFTGVAQTGRMLDSFMTRPAVSRMTARDG
jgi:hypothetical protein